MSLKAVCQVLVYFDTFKNWDLYDQGVYYVKSRIQYCPNDTTKLSALTSAAPYHMIQIKKDLISRAKNKIKAQSQMLDNQYKTKSFLVRFTDEQIDLDEAVIFKIEMQTYPQLNTEGVYLVLELYHAVDFYFKEEAGRELEFVKGATARVKLNRFEEGLAEYVSVGFGENYRGNINLQVFSILMDYKFRFYKSVKKEKTVKEVDREKIETVEEYCKWLQKYSGVNSEFCYDCYIKHIRFYAMIACNKWTKCLNKQIPVKCLLPKYCLQQTKQLVPTLVDDKQFSNYMANYKFAPFDASKFIQQLQQIRLQTYTFLLDFLKQLQSYQLKKIQMKKHFQLLIRDRSNEFIFRKFVKQEDLCSERFSGREKRSFAQKLRESDRFSKFKPLPLQDMSMFNKPQTHPILFHQITTYKPTTQKNFTSINNRNIMFVFAHGFQGTACDLLSIKAILKQFFPKANYLMSRANQGMTEGDIMEMGERLSKQIKKLITDQQLEKDLEINMIGHSMGGLILRAALPHLEQYSQNLNTFATFGSPHIGYLHGIKTMVKTGLWFFKNWGKTLSLQQLAMTDNNNMHETTLFKLSKIGSLKNFRKVVLFSSYQDSYAPWHSARIHVYKNSINDEKAIIQRNMVRSVFEGGRLEEVHRIDVNFSISETNVDSMIGRTAHMLFLSEQSVLRMVLNCTPQIFC